MPQRTIQQATVQLDAMAEVLSPQLLAPYMEELEGAQAGAQEMAHRHQDQQGAHAEALSEEIQLGLREIRERFGELVAEGVAGRLTSREYDQQWSALRRRQRELESRVGELSGAADQLDEIEANPVAWADRTFYEKFPGIRPEFSF